MKYVLALIVFVGIVGCQPKKDPVFNMSWHCGTNFACAQHMGGFSGAGTFQTEQDCLIWETAFINSYYGSYVTSCTASN